MKTRIRRFLMITAVSVLAIVAALAAFIWWGPVPVSDKRVMLDFMLGLWHLPAERGDRRRKTAAAAGIPRAGLLDRRAACPRDDRHA